MRKSDEAGPSSPTLHGGKRVDRLKFLELVKPPYSSDNTKGGGVDRLTVIIPLIAVANECIFLYVAVVGGRGSMQESALFGPCLEPCCPASAYKGDDDFNAISRFFKLKGLGDP